MSVRRGVRSATFALGVIQGLAHTGVLGAFNYLSTVSGGGYIGGWFTAWLHRDGPTGREQVIRALDPAVPDETGRRKPVEHVRRTCRYLAPGGGMLSADLWTLLATLARNLFLNWLVILPLLAAALLVPRIYFAVAYAVGPLNKTSPWFLAGALANYAVALGYLVLNFAGRGGSWSQRRFLALFLAPVMAGSVLITLFYSSYPGFDLGWTLAVAAALPAVGCLVMGLLAKGLFSPTDATGAAVHAPLTLRTVLAAAAAGPLLGAGAYWCAAYEFRDANVTEVYAAVAVPLILGADPRRHCAVRRVCESPPRRCRARVVEPMRCVDRNRDGRVARGRRSRLLCGRRPRRRASAHSTGRAASAHTRQERWSPPCVPLLSSVAGLLARSAGETNERPSPVRLIVQRISLPLVIVLLLGSLAWANLRATELLEYHYLDGVKCTPEIGAANDQCHPGGGGLGEVLILFAAYVTAGLLMSTFVPANRFSLHGMYRQRLVRTFLGASRRDRRPNAFTGFDGHDDLLVHQLADVRPLHVINTTLNAVSSTRVATHERQSESFTFTPLHAGNRQTGYRAAVRVRLRRRRRAAPAFRSAWRWQSRARRRVPPWACSRTNRGRFS